MNEGGYFKHLYSVVSVRGYGFILTVRVTHEIRSKGFTYSSEWWILFKQRNIWSDNLRKVLGLCSLVCRILKEKNEIDFWVWIWWQDSSTRKQITALYHNIHRHSIFLYSARKRFHVLHTLVLCGHQIHGSSRVPKDICHTTKLQPLGCLSYSRGNNSLPHFRSGTQEAIEKISVVYLACGIK